MILPLLLLLLPSATGHGNLHVWHTNAWRRSGQQTWVMLCSGALQRVIAKLQSCDDNACMQLVMHMYLSVNDCALAAYRLRLATKRITKTCLAAFDPTSCTFSCS
jgi:hypothetical protein